mgnify:FL=1
MGRRRSPITTATPPATATPSRKAKPAWVTVSRFLAGKPSVGPSERPGGEADSYSQLDLDLLSLLAIVRSSDAGDFRSVACIPDWRLCAFSSVSDPSKITMRRSLGRRCPSPPRGEQIRVDVRAGVIITGLGSAEIRLWLPTGFRDALSDCTRRAKRFAVCNLGLYFGAFDQHDGHANGLVFDLSRRVLERFEPAGRKSSVLDAYDVVIERLFLSRLPPGWKYEGTRASAPHRGVQERADSFDGMCVTHSFFYTLLRLLNPERDAADIQEFMTRGTAKDLRTRVLRLNRYMMDTLRAHPRGSLRQL